MGNLNIAVVGAGLIGRNHIGLVRQAGACTLCAIVDPDVQAKNIANEYDVRYFEDLQSLLQAKIADGIILATPNSLHYEQAIACIDAGVPVLIEKPVTETVAQAEKLVGKVKQLHAKVIVGHHRMHSAIMQRAHETIGSGAIGDIVAVQGSALFYKPDAYYAAGPWRSKKGGGPILINMIHEIGNLRYLCGEIDSVQAMPSNARRRFEVEDTVAILLRFTSGAVGTFILSDTAASCRSWEQTARENPDYHHDAEEDCYHIAGTLGSLSVPTMTLHRFESKAQASWYQPMQVSRNPVEVVDPLERQLAHFCTVINGDATPLVSVEDGYKNLLITEQIARACGSF